MIFNSHTSTFEIISCSSGEMKSSFLSVVCAVPVGKGGRAVFVTVEGESL
jgi:hypothetical protein